jgi:hypothetical protein
VDLPGDGRGRGCFWKIQELSPKTEAQRALKNRAIQVATDVAQTRLLLFEHADNSIPMPFLVVLVFWLAVIFMSFSLFLRLTPMNIAAMLLFAISASGRAFPYPGVEPAVCRTDADFQHATAQRPCAAWMILATSRLNVRIWPRAAVAECLLSRSCWGLSGHQPREMPRRTSEDLQRMKAAKHAENVAKRAAARARRHVAKPK